MIKTMVSDLPNS